MTIEFLKYYLKERYSLHIWEYYDISSASVSKWKEIPDYRLLQFKDREGSIEVNKLMENISSDFNVNFIEYYIKEELSSDIERYFNVSKTTSSKWRMSKIPNKRIAEFKERENISNINDYLTL